MSQIQLKISAKQLDAKVNYIKPSESYFIKNVINNKEIEQIDFLARRLVKEVRSKKDKKEFVKTALRTITVSLSILSIVDPTFTFAATVNPLVSPMSPSTNMITGSDIIQICKYVIGIALALSFGVAMLTSVVANSLGYFGKSSDAFKWVTEILKAFTMTIATPVLILTIAFVAYLLFGGSDWFVSPF